MSGGISSSIDDEATKPTVPGNERDSPPLVNKPSISTSGADEEADVHQKSAEENNVIGSQRSRSTDGSRLKVPEPEHGIRIHALEPGGGIRVRALGPNNGSLVSADDLIFPESSLRILRYHGTKRVPEEDRRYNIQR
jgi:hypothetical protein